MATCVKADVEPLAVAWCCPECEEEITSTVDLSDYTNLSMGLMLDEDCSACGAHYQVEVL